MKATISIIQMDVLTGQVKHNIEVAYHYIQKALKSKPDIIVLPEMWNTGFAYKNLKEITEESHDHTLKFLRDVAAEAECYVVGGSIPELKDGKVYNTCYVISPDKKIAGSFSKVHLFKLHNEDEFFAHGKKADVIKTDLCNIGVAICYDLRFPELFTKFALHEASMIFVPAQYPYPRQDHWKTLLKARAIENQVFVIGANRVGGRSIKHFGNSMVVDPYGNIVEEADERETVLTARIDLGQIEKVRGQLPYLSDRKPEVYR